VAEEPYKAYPGDIFNIGASEMVLRRNNYAFNQAMGKLPTQEDAYVIEEEGYISDFVNTSLFAVIDGHSGTACAEFLRDNLPNYIRFFFMKNGVKQLDLSNNILETYLNSTKEMFSKIDEDFGLAYPKISYSCGATITYVHLIGNRLFCVNLGDGTAVMCSKG
jgi:serine/threonine protein phosphatase PrpC